MKTTNDGNSGMSKTERCRGGRAWHQHGRVRRLLVVLAVVVVTISCSTTGGQTVRATSTGKTIKSASTSAPAGEPVIETSAREDAGITELEIYEGSGEFIDREAA